MKKKDILDFARSYYASAQVTEFLESIFGSDSGGFVEIRMIRGKRVRCMFYRNVEQAANDLFINKVHLLTDWNAYFGVCPRNERQGKEENVQLVNCLWADLDCYDKKKMQDEPEIVENRKARVDSLKGFRLHPSFIVNSGRGLHCYWLLEESYAIKNEQDFLNIKGYLKGLSHVLGGDSTFDLPRCFRVPGTVNLKNKNQPLPVEIIEFNSQLRYKLSQFDEFKEELDVSSVNVDTSIDDIPDRFWRVLQENTKLKLTWEGKRKDINLKDDHSRSVYDMSLATLLMPYNFKDSEVAAILVASPSGKGKEAKPQYLNITIGKAKAEWEKRKKEAEEREEKKKKRKKVKKVKRKGFKASMYAKKIKEEIPVIYDQQKRLWWYDIKEGIWKDNFESVCRSILRKDLLAGYDINYYQNEVIEAIKDLSYQENIPSEPASHLIPFKNGIYDMSEDKLKPFDSRHFFINKLGVNFNPEQREYPNIDKLFYEIVGKRDVITLYEIIAYSMYRGYPYPKCFFLYGNGANGKSAYCQVLRRIISNENISSTSLETLQYNKFGTSALYGKLANISPEISHNILKRTDILKQLTGVDLVRGEKKFKDEFHFVNYSKLIFIGNEVPYSEDKSFAFYRRMLLIPFPKRFEIKIKADPFIVKKIPEREFEAVGFECIQILKELEKNLFTFTRHKRTKQIEEEYERLSDPIGVFLKEKIEDDQESYIPVKNFNKEVKAYQAEKELRVWTDEQISRVMKQKGYTKKTLRISKNIKGTYRFIKAYLDVNWKILEKDEDA